VTSYEDFCALTEGPEPPAEDCEFYLSLFATEPLGGEMVLDIEEVDGRMLADGDGDSFDDIDPFVEEVEDKVSHLSQMDRVVVAGNALASLPDENALLVVLEWLCSASDTAKGVVAKEAVALVANRHNRVQALLNHAAANDQITTALTHEAATTHKTICEVLAMVSPAMFGSVVGEAE